MEYLNEAASADYFALDAQNLYLATSSSVFFLPLAGGSKKVRAENVSVGALAVDAANIYWAGASGVLSVPIANGPFTTHSTESAYIVAVNATHVFWGNGQDKTIKSVPLGGGSVVTLATGVARAKVFKLDANALYWTDWEAGQVMSVPLAGGTPKVLASNQEYPSGLAVNATHIFWTTEGYSNPGTVMRATLSGSEPTLISTQDTPRSVTVDDTHVYWSCDYESLLRKAPLAGGPITDVYQMQDNLLQVEVNATSLFWATHTRVLSVTPK